MGHGRRRTSWQSKGPPRRGGLQQEGGPVFLLRSFNCLEVPRFGGPSQVPQFQGIVLPSLPGRFVEFPMESSQVWGLPRLGLISGPRVRGVFLEQGCKLDERSRQPLIQPQQAGAGGGGGTLKSLIIVKTVSQFVSLQRGRGWLRISERGARSIVLGTWSEPLEGSELSQLRTRGRRWGWANAKCITQGRALPAKGNLVYSQVGLRSAKPPSAAFSK